MENLEGLTLEERERLLKVRKRIQLLQAKNQYVVVPLLRYTMQ